MSNIIRGGWLTLNRNCDMRCKHCYQSDTNFDPKRQLSSDISYRLIDILVKSGAKNVVLIGGEPTLYHDLCDVIKRFVDNGVRPILITNGRSLSDMEKLKKIVSFGLRDISISIKAADDIGYVNVTGTKNSFSLVKQAIQNCLSLDISLGISVTMENYFIKYVDRYIDLLLSLNVPHINFDMGSPVLSTTGVDVSDIPNPSVLAEATEYVHGRLKDSGQSYSFYVTVPLCLFSESTKKELIESSKISTSCHVSRGTSVVFSDDGAILPCNHFSSFSFGKLDSDFSDEEEFARFWQKDEMVEFRSNFNSYPVKKCSYCKDWNICGGGCKIKWMYYNPKDFIK